MSLATYDLTLVFRCAVELAEATIRYHPEESASIAENSPSDQWEEPPDAVWRQREILDAIELDSNRLKRALGATGPLDSADYLRDQSAPKWEDFRSRFKYSSHSSTVRQALLKLANAAIDLSGYASVRVLQAFMRERGLRLLKQGLAQLWHGMTNAERLEVRSFLPRTHAALSWPRDPAAEPADYDGPEGIELADQYRVIDTTLGFAARTTDFLYERQQVALAFRRRWKRPHGDGDSVTGDSTLPAPAVLDQEAPPLTNPSNVKSRMLDGGENHSPAATSGEIHPNTYRLDGDFWTVSFAAKTIRLKDSLGLKYIAQLLASKHRHIDAAVLRSAATGNVRVQPSAGLELLDQQAVQEYQAVYDSLTEELAEAKQFNDFSKHYTFRDFLIVPYKRSLGS